MSEKSVSSVLMAQIFEYPIKVTEEHIDQFKHVNNEVYVSWIMQASNAHSESFGYNLQKYVEDGAAFVVRRHEIDYLAPVVLGEDIIVETWVPEMSVVKTIREFRITRTRDKKVVLQAKTTFAYVSLTTGRPITIPQKLHDVFATI